MRQRVTRMFSPGGLAKSQWKREESDAEVRLIFPGTSVEAPLAEKAGVYLPNLLRGAPGA